MFKKTGSPYGIISDLHNYVLINRIVCTYNMPWKIWENQRPILFQIKAIKGTEIVILCKDDTLTLKQINKYLDSASYFYVYLLSF